MTKESPASLNKLRVPELKKMLEDRGLSTAGKKADLVTRLEDVFDKETNQEPTEGAHKQPSDHVEAKEMEVDSGSGNHNKEERHSEPQAQHNEEKDETRQDEQEKQGAESETQQEGSKMTEDHQDTRKRKTEEKEQGGTSQSSENNNNNNNKDTKDRNTDKDNRSLSAQNTHKRQRKWAEQQDNLNFSTDTLNDMLTNYEQDNSKHSSSSPSLETSSSSTNNSLSTSTNKQVVREPPLVLKKEKPVEPEQLEVPPARKPVSRTLFVDKFVRPFTEAQAKELMSKTGNVELFWMNGIKSQCYVTYKTEEEAVASRNAICNLLWPPANHSRLRAEFATEEEALNAANKGKPVPQANNSQTVPPPTTTDRSRERTNTTPRDNYKDERTRKTIPLETWFRKTTALPPIYWMALSEEDVLKKKTAALQQSR